MEGRMARTINIVEQAARRDAILDAAQRLILSNGYERLTVQDVLEDLRISKGAFYHYFDSKTAVVEALTARLVDDSGQALARIAEDSELGAIEKLQRFFGEIVRWKSAQQNLMVAMLPVWYAPDNLAFRLLVNRATANRLAPLLSVIVRQGVEQRQFATAYPEQAGPIIVAIVQALQEAMAQQLLSGAAKVKDVIATHSAHIEAIERYLGVPAGTLYQADARVVNSWIAALRRADHPGKPQ
jgi:AcrR family transcriptional regulator